MSWTLHLRSSHLQTNTQVRVQVTTASPPPHTLFPQLSTGMPSRYNTDLVTVTECQVQNRWNWGREGGGAQSWQVREKPCLAGQQSVYRHRISLCKFWIVASLGCLKKPPNKGRSLPSLRKQLLPPTACRLALQLIPPPCPVLRGREIKFMLGMENGQSALRMNFFPDCK